MEYQKKPILTAAQTKKWEALTVQKGLETFDSLMEKAGTAVAQEIIRSFPKSKTLVLCGPGNNGGDGYVSARHLQEAGWDVTVALDPQLSSATHLNKETWKGSCIPLGEIDFDAFDLGVDAFFGTGLERPLTGLYLETLQKLSQKKLPCVAVDIPSGIHADTGEVRGMSAVADLTVTFGSLKQGHVLLPGKSYCGKIEIADIGFIDLSALQESFAYENNPIFWANALPLPRSTDHKYTRGHLMIVAGEEMTGAPRLAAEASRRIGAGMTTLLCPSSVKEIYQINALGTLVKPYASLSDFEEALNEENVKGILIGPGLPPNEGTKELVKLALNTNKKLVLDAGALSCFQEDNKYLLKHLHDQCILLPHEGEFQRIFPQRATKIISTSQAAKKCGSILLLKGSDTVISSPEGICYINTNGPSTLATAGTGDVLAGIVAGLFVQGVSPLMSASAAAWIQGDAAHLFGQGLIAEDLIQEIPRVLKDFL